MEIKTVAIALPEGSNLIFGQTHFIKTVEDLYEIMVSSAAQAKFGIAFCSDRTYDVAHIKIAIASRCRLKEMDPMVV